MSAYADVLKCNSSLCGHLFAFNPKPNAGVHEHDETNIEIFSRRNKALIAKLLDCGLVKDGMRVLDIGAGLGHIVTELRRQATNVKITCLEAAPNAVQHLKRNGFNVLQDIDELKVDVVGYFDFVFMVELIEHIEDPMNLLAACRSVLAPTGSMFLTTPCGELRNGSNKTATYDIPEHVQFFTESSLRLAITLTGFSKVEYIEMREFHAGSIFSIIKRFKDSARTLRSMIRGRHHLIAIVN